MSVFKVYAQGYHYYDTHEPCPQCGRKKIVILRSGAGIKIDCTKCDWETRVSWMDIQITRHSIEDVIGYQIDKERERYDQERDRPEQPGSPA